MSEMSLKVIISTDYDRKKHFFQYSFSPHLPNDRHSLDLFAIIVEKQSYKKTSNQNTKNMD